MNGFTNNPFFFLTSPIYGFEKTVNGSNIQPEETGGGALSGAQASAIAQVATNTANVAALTTKVNELPQSYDGTNNYTYPSQIAAGQTVLSLKQGQTATGAFDATKWEFAGGSGSLTEEEFLNVDLTSVATLSPATLSKTTWAFAYLNGNPYDIGEFLISTANDKDVTIEAFGDTVKIVLIGVAA